VRLAAWALGILGAPLVLAGLLWFGYGLYVQWIVARSPATMAMIRTGEGELWLGSYRAGDQVMPAAASPLPVPAASPAPPAAGPDAGASKRLAETSAADLTPLPPLLRVGEEPALGAAQGDGGSGSAPAAAPPPGRQALPPTNLRIPKIAVDAPVVLADNDNLPRFKGVGWYIGSGFPGFRGNVVLFGHLNGQFETFARLDELRPGDPVIVQAMERTYRYTVSETKVVPEDDVAVMAPTRDSRLTLITCTGEFYPATRDYSHRLVVTASPVED